MCVLELKFLAYMPLHFFTGFLEINLSSCMLQKTHLTKITKLQTEKCCMCQWQVAEIFIPWHYHRTVVEEAPTLC